ncbi:MAG: protein kinase domain-containing protein [Candidatus Dormibacteria bacterium]
MSSLPSNIGDYQVRGVLGRGASGTVYLAYQEFVDRRVALKELSTELTADPVFRERFRAEAEIMARLDNDHCVRVFDFFQREKNDYLVSELIEGASLRGLVQHSGELTPEESLGVIKGALQGLAHAHSLGLIHRDIKPENVLLDGEGVSKLADFGQAASQSGPGAAGGMPAGSPAYMSPEMVGGGTLDARSDLYSAGAVLFELLTGRPPFVADNPLAVMRMQREAPVPDAHTVNPKLGPAMTGLLAGGLAKDPADRPQSAEAMLTALEAAAVEAYGADWEKRSSVKKKVAATVGAGMGLLAMLATAGGLAAAGAVGTAAVASAAGAAAGSGGVMGASAWIAGAALVAVLAVGGGYLALHNKSSAGGNSTNGGGSARASNGAVALASPTPKPSPQVTPSTSPETAPSVSPEPSPTSGGPTGITPSANAPSANPTVPSPQRSIAARPVPSPSHTFVIIANKYPAAPLNISNQRVYYDQCTSDYSTPSPTLTCGFYSDGQPYYSQSTAYPSSRGMDCTFDGGWSIAEQYDFSNPSTGDIPVTITWAINWANGARVSGGHVSDTIRAGTAGTHGATASAPQSQPGFTRTMNPVYGSATYTLSWTDGAGQHTLSSEQPMYWACAGFGAT